MRTGRSVPLISKAQQMLDEGKITWEEYGPALRKETDATVRALLKEARQKMEREGLLTPRKKPGKTGGEPSKRHRLIATGRVQTTTPLFY